MSVRTWARSEMRPRRCRTAWTARTGWAVVALLLVGVGLGAPAWAADAAPVTGDAGRIGRIEDHMRALQEELKALKESNEVSEAKVAEVEEQISGLEKLLQRVKFGGYGSVRYEASDLREQKNTFTFRRLVFTTDAQLAEKMRFYSELEYERFRKLELEKDVNAQDGGLRALQAVEGTSGSEIALEQAWLEYAIHPSFRPRFGGVLVPLGRFNLNHDDNLWNLTRRTLVDTGAPVIPIKAAWDELGAGFTGDLELGRSLLAYQFYVVNGAVIDLELEEIAQMRDPRRDKLELEAELAPTTGTFGNDTKEAKAFTGRVALTPAEGQEIGLSFYTGRYTPDWLNDETVSSFALDGIARFLGFELEGEAVTTHWGGIRDVAQSFASRALDSESANAAAFDPTLESEIEFELANLAKRKTGYWVELRYPFWPGFLPRGGFDDPRLVPVFRFEQVWYNDLLREAGLANGMLEDWVTDDTRIGRATLGLAYRPTPPVAFTAAYEHTWSPDTLFGLTNYLPANENEKTANSFMLGVTYGF